MSKSKEAYIACEHREISKYEAAKIITEPKIMHWLVKHLEYPKDLALPWFKRHDLFYYVKYADTLSGVDGLGSYAIAEAVRRKFIDIDTGLDAIIACDDCTQDKFNALNSMTLRKHKLIWAVMQLDHNEVKELL